MKSVAIIDYSIGNLFSVFQACKAVGLDPKIVSEPTRLKEMDAAILPGVGAFSQGIAKLRATGLDTAIHNLIKEGKPFFGICLGMQLLFEESVEFENCDGLAVVPGSVRHLRERVSLSLPVPKISWSEVYQKSKDWSNTPLEGIKNGTDFYFVHSYFCSLTDPEYLLATSKHGDFEYCAAIQKDNIFATQFHPEKSAMHGLQIYQKWKEIYLPE